ncbi:MAG TPA: hypothetical protein VLV54_20250 [Thermoanaerobaculia bacterium]|nr:hypothetical protein [Thermoanaerobaculia bacterium]
MSFKAREIMIDVLPAARPFRRGAPGFGLCGEATRNEEDDEVDCSEATRPPGGGPSSGRPEADLVVLRQQLHQALSAL